MSGTNRKLGYAVAAAGLIGVPAAADSYTTIDFEGFAHGEVVAVGSASGTYIEIAPGVTVDLTVHNVTGPDLAVVFDTTLTGTRDPDLEDPWATGNLPANTDLGKVLIIQENKKLLVDNGVSGLSVGDIVKADDEADKPAGYLDFLFEDSISELGFDLIDIERNVERDNGYVAVLFSGGNAVGEITFGTLNALFDGNGDNSPSGDLVFGDNSANRVEVLPISVWTASATGGPVQSVDRVRFYFNGSGAIDNIKYLTVPPPPPIPSPAAAAFGLVGLGGVALRRRRR